jgi:hypothetical protein
MPINWTPENDRKFLLLMIKSVDAKVSMESTQVFYSSDSIDVVALWGPDPPTVKALRHRLAKLRDFSTDQVESGTRKSTKSGGSHNPKDPKAGHKRGFELSETPEPPKIKRSPSRGRDWQWHGDEMEVKLEKNHQTSVVVKKESQDSDSDWEGEADLILFYSRSRLSYDDCWLQIIIC